MKRRIAILGSTGSIGSQALQVIELHNDLFQVELLTANNNHSLLVQQALKFNPATVVIGNKAKYAAVKEALASTDIKVFAGEDAIAQAVEFDSIDIVLTAMVGFSGLLPTLSAVKAGKTIALANKETLVVAGELINRLALENGVSIIPVDSEHSAIFQCLSGENSPIEKIILTASGGPFLNHTREQLRRVKSTDALKHPNWCMGDKVTIDSASLMNKGLEVIEARWLFGVNPNQIDVVIHPQSIVHSLVQFEDSSVKAQLGLPDMRVPIQYALSYPYRLKSDFKRFRFSDYPNLTFEAPDLQRFPNLEIARYALERGGNMPCILNAANEIAVEYFLRDQIGFYQMSELIQETINGSNFLPNPSLEDYAATNHETRIVANELINKGI